MSKNQFGNEAHQAPFNSNLGEMAYWDFEQAVHLFNAAERVVSGIKTATTLEPFGIYGINTATSAVTVTLPADPKVGTWVKLYDEAANWHRINATVARNGQKIMGLSENMALNIQGDNVKLQFIGGEIGWGLTV